MKYVSRIFFMIPVLSGMLLLSPLAQSEEVSVSKARLISSQNGAGDETEITFGLHIKLDKGWKTYWRTPGDAGIPPQFNWEGSVNVENVETLWPKPIIFDTYGLKTLGYKDEIVFPFKITPKQAGQPISAKLEIFYGVCEEVCIPIKQTVQLTIPAGPATTSPEAGLIDYFENQVPKALDQSGFVSEIKAVADDEKTFKVHVVAKSAFDKPILILEGEDGDFFEIGPVETDKSGLNYAFNVKAELASVERPLKGRMITAIILDKELAVEGQITVK